MVLAEQIASHAGGEQGGDEPCGFVKAAMFGFVGGDDAPVFDDNVRNGLHEGSPKKGTGEDFSGGGHRSGHHGGQAQGLPGLHATPVVLELGGRIAQAEQ